MKLTAILATVMIFAVAAYAGPSLNLGLGLGWMDEGLYPAWSVGMGGGIAGPVGLMGDVHIAFLSASMLGNLALTVDLMSHPEGPQFYLLGGIGGALGVTNLAPVKMKGLGYGWMFGCGMRGEGGGIRVFGTFTDGLLGVGVNAYLSLGL